MDTNKLQMIAFCAISCVSAEPLLYWMVNLLYWIVNTALFISSLPLLWPFVFSAASHFWRCALALFTDYDLDCVLDLSAFSSLSGVGLDCSDPSTPIIKLPANVFLASVNPLLHKLNCRAERKTEL